MTKNVIILNSAPMCGKDTAANIISEIFDAEHLRFKDKLYEIAAIAAGIPLDEMIELATDRRTKELEAVGLFYISGISVSPRKWLQHVSERVVKPICGQDYFGEELNDKIFESEKNVIVCSDSGFIRELTPLLYERHNILFIRLHREGFTFDGDTRKHIYPENEKYLCNLSWVDFNNNFDDVKDYERAIVDLVDEWLEGDLL